MAKSFRVDPTIPSPPKGGIVLRVYARIPEKTKTGYRKGSCRVSGGDFASRDNCWMTRSEWQSLIPKEPSVGQSQDFPARILRRFAIKHLIDNTRGEPVMWAELRRGKLRMRVESVSDKTLTMRLSGSVLLATAKETCRSDRGYDAKFEGLVTYDRTKKRIVRFDLLAIGDHWGEINLSRGARPGRSPLGVAFELGDGSDPADGIPPQGARDLSHYYR